MPETSRKPNRWARRKARRALVQAVYQWQLSNNSFESIVKDFESGEALKKADKQYFSEVLHYVVYHADKLDNEYRDLLDRSVEHLDHVERAILRLATTEFCQRIDVPYPVVIDEYVELAKTFGAQDSYKYINGVLDKLARSLRSTEVDARNRGK